MKRIKIDKGWLVVLLFFLMLVGGFMWACCLTSFGEVQVPLNASSATAAFLIVIGLVGFAGGVGYMVSEYF